MHAWGDESLFPAANLRGDQMFWSELQLPSPLRRRLVTIHFPPTAKEDKARKGLHRTIETVWKSCYPVRHEIYWLKSFLGASGAGMGFDKSEREIVISLSVCRRTGGTCRLGMAKGVTCFVLPQHCFPRWCDQLPLNKRWTSNSVRITTAVFQFGMRNRKLVILPLPGGAGTYHLVLKHTTSPSRSELNSVWYWLFFFLKALHASICFFRLH